MKKALAAVLIIMLLATLMAGCNSKGFKYVETIIKEELKEGIEELKNEIIGDDGDGDEAGTGNSGTEKTESQLDSEGVLPSQYSNSKYSFKQGYRSDWKVAESDSEGDMLDSSTGLVAVFTPANETGAEYCIYYCSGEGFTSSSSLDDVVEMMTDSENSLYFNNKFCHSSSRYNYKKTSSPKTVEGKYNKLEFYSVTYSFQKDGEEWKGIFNVTKNGAGIFVVTFEAKADLYARFEQCFIDQLNAFRKPGWEM